MSLIGNLQDALNLDRVEPRLDGVEAGIHAIAGSIASAAQDVEEATERAAQKLQEVTDVIENKVAGNP